MLPKQYSYELYDAGYGPELDVREVYQNNNEDFPINQTTLQGKWFYYTATFNGEKVTLYKDGNQVSTSEYDQAIAHSKDPLWIGSNGTDYFKGMLDELRIYNYAMTPAQVKGI